MGRKMMRWKVRVEVWRESIGLFLKTNNIRIGQTMPREGAEGDAAHCP